METLKDLKITELNSKDKLYEYEQGKEYAKSWLKQSAIDDIKDLKLQISNFDYDNFELKKTHLFTEQLSKNLKDKLIERVLHQIEYIKMKFNLKNDEL